MKKSFIVLNLTILSLILVSFFPIQAQNCGTGNTRSSNYIQRDNDKRCEGIAPIDIAGSFSLISLSIGRIREMTDSLKLEVPSRNNRAPKVIVRSLPKNYQLAPFTLRPQGSRYQFKWSNYVIDREDIALESLRATASISDGKLIYLPVIFNQAKTYDIVLFANVRSQIKELQILQNNEVIYETSRPNWQPKGEIFFSWDGRTSDGKLAKAGLYELRVKALLEQDDAPPRNAPINITFEHNPQWLK
ncbi:FlgD immunoglobulin-like domain containing protein [Microcystis sp. CS-574]|uniref:FlgD immunoglobulin-like domain containing protein n=1 Tax=Microcystis sp. CS-574 TaxID=3021718 RepID=UPI00232DACA8|nr:FlgD immunoglobulin-like domain containing protein [Microcystis sp. CS-574]MDB9406562.1 FlgD immunoglobulin-like domain containing protein [Microcystis sp. CS-574]